MTVIEIGKFTTVESAANGIILRRGLNPAGGDKEFFVGLPCEDELLKVLQQRKEARENLANLATEALKDLDKVKNLVTLAQYGDVRNEDIRGHLGTAANAVYQAREALSYARALDRNARNIPVEVS